MAFSYPVCDTNCQHRFEGYFKARLEDAYFGLGKEIMTTKLTLEINGVVSLVSSPLL